MELELGMVWGGNKGTITQMAAKASAEGELPPGEYMKSKAKLWTAPEHQRAKSRQRKRSP